MQCTMIMWKRLVINGRFYTVKSLFSGHLGTVEKCLLMRGIRLRETLQKNGIKTQIHIQCILDYF